MPYSKLVNSKFTPQCCSTGPPYRSTIMVPLFPPMQCYWLGGKLTQNYACKCEKGSQVTATILLSWCCSSNRGCKFISYNLVNARNGILIRFDRKIFCCKLLFSCLSLKLFSVLTVPRDMYSIYSWKKSVFRIRAREGQKTGFLVKCEMEILSNMPVYNFCKNHCT